jgi:hypothetical protein
VPVGQIVSFASRDVPEERVPSVNKTPHRSIQAKLAHYVPARQAGYETLGHRHPEVGDDRRQLEQIAHKKNVSASELQLIVRDALESQGNSVRNPWRQH